MGDDKTKLPTIWQALSEWLGVQLPTAHMPQTLKNADKALARVLLATGENVEARMKRNTAKVKAQGNIDVEGMYRTAEERIQIQNRASVSKIALEDLRAQPADDDAKTEIGMIG
jgi:hypothetical protein